MSINNQSEIIEKACRNLIMMFESGEMPLAITRTFIEAAKYDKPSNRWSLGNKLIMLAFDTFDARGYDQWQKAVFFHELGHAAHSQFAVLKPGQDAEQEIIAETVGAVLCRLYGIEGFEPHAYKYISGYSGAENPREVVKKIMHLLSDIEKCLQIILENADSSSLAKICVA